MIATPVPKSTPSASCVLIVEDESLVALDLEERLTRLGYQVSAVVDNGADALSHAGRNKIDLVLMDIHIRGDMDGIETARILRDTVKVPVIFLTAHADAATLQRAGLAEPFGYVLKPFDERELRATIEMAHYRYRAEERVRTMERWLATTLSSIGDGVIATDEEGRISFINVMAETVCGWTRSEALGRHLPEVFPIFTAAGDMETIARFERTISEGVTATLGENRSLRTRDGRLVPVDERFAPIRDEHASVTGCVIIFRDITGRKSVELALQQRNAELEAMNAKLVSTQQQLVQSEKMSLVGQLAAGVAHEINNPLAYVFSNFSSLELYVTNLSSLLTAYALMEHELPPDNPLRVSLLELKNSIEFDLLVEDIVNVLGESREGLQRVRKIVQDLKDFSHIEAPQWQLADLHLGIESTLNIVAHDLKYKAEVIRDYGELPLVRCLPFQINQVFLNLLVNASQAIEGKGRITVRTRHVDDEVLVEIADDGRGIAAADLSRVFEPFFTTKPIGVGTGLGLSVSWGIVQSHGGRIEVRSTLGIGTEFTIRLPVEQPTDHAG